MSKNWVIVPTVRNGVFPVLDFFAQLLLKFKMMWSPTKLEIWKPEKACNIIISDSHGSGGAAIYVRSERPWFYWDTINIFEILRILRYWQEICNSCFVYSKPLCMCRNLLIHPHLLLQGSTSTLYSAASQPSCNVALIIFLSLKKKSDNPHRAIFIEGLLKLRVI